MTITTNKSSEPRGFRCSSASDAIPLHFDAASPLEAASAYVRNFCEDGVTVDVRVEDLSSAPAEDEPGAMCTIRVRTAASREIPAQPWENFATIESAYQI